MSLLSRGNETTTNAVATDFRIESNILRNLEVTIPPIDIIIAILATLGCENNVTRLVYDMNVSDIDVFSSFDMPSIIIPRESNIIPLEYRHKFCKLIHIAGLSFSSFSLNTPAIVVIKMCMPMRL